MPKTRVIFTIEEDIIKRFNESVEEGERSKILEALIRVFLNFREKPDTSLLNFYTEQFREAEKKKDGA